MALSLLRIQSRDTRSHGIGLLPAFLIPSNSMLQRQNSWWVWLRRQWLLSSTKPPFIGQRFYSRCSKVSILGSQSLSPQLVCRENVQCSEWQDKKIRGFLPCQVPGNVAQRFFLGGEAVPKNRELWNFPQKTDFICIRMWPSSSLCLLSKTIKVLMVSIYQEAGNSLRATS